MSTHNQTVVRHRANPTNHARRHVHARELSPVRGEVQHLVETMREKVDQIKDGTARAIHGTEKNIQERPWTSLGVALGVGMILGFFLRRR